VGECPTSCKKEGGIVWAGEMSGGTCQGGICPGEMYGSPPAIAGRRY